MKPHPYIYPTMSIKVAVKHQLSSSPVQNINTIVTSGVNNIFKNKQQHKTI